MLKLKKRHSTSKKNKQPANRKIYDSARWRGPNGLRLMRLRTSPFCVECGKPGNVVDHIDPINNGGDPWNFDNTQTMCSTCHDIKRQKESKLYN